MSEQPAEFELEVRKLRKINDALMRRVERSTDISGNGYSLFQTAIALENEVRTRTRDLHDTFQKLSIANSRLTLAKEEAERARSDLANAIDAVQEGFALFAPDETLVMCNRRFRTLFPDLEEAIKPGVSFLDYARRAAASPSLQLEEGQTQDDWLRMRLSKHGQHHASFVQPLTGDRWIQISERRTPNGGAAIIQTDITDLVRWERRELDKRLDEQARLVRATLDHLTQGVCVFDRAQHLVAWNDRYRELLGLPFALLKPGVSFARIADFFKQNTLVTSQDTALQILKWVMRDLPRPPLAVELKRSDGKILDSHCRNMPDGGFVISFTDVTAEREAAAALHRAKETLEQRVIERTAELTTVNAKLRREIAERRQIEQELIHAKNAAETANLSKTRFLAAASHDLLQPLNAARLFISSLSESGLAAEQSAVVERIDSAFASVESLLNALLDISKLDAGAVETSIVTLPVSTILQPIANEFRAIASRKGLELIVMPSSAAVVSDTNYLRRIVQNLVANAVKYTPEGRVLVGCRRRGDRLWIEVWDTGIGISAADQETIFEEFLRIDSRAVAGERGMGLGLAIVKRACQLLDHQIIFRSKPGKGSVFSVGIPLASSAAKHTRRALAEQQETENAAGVIALLVENDSEIRHGMISLLERWGVDTLAVSSTDEALFAAGQLGMAPDVILADYRLDGRDTGAQTIRALRACFGEETPAILITADRSAEVAEFAERDEVHLLTKPLQPAKLRALLQWVSTHSAANGRGTADTTLTI